MAHTSLAQLCSRLEANTGISMSPEGLNQRFNSQAAQFLQQILAYVLHQQLCSTNKITTMYTNYFRRIRVLDSTHFQIPDKFASTYIYIEREIIIVICATYNRSSNCSKTPPMPSFLITKAEV